MSQHDDMIRLHHMLDYSRTALRIAAGRSRQDLGQDETVRLALTRAVEVVGEAAARVTLPTRNNLPGIPWVQIVGTRHRLVHGYDNVDMDVLWAIVNQDLPALIVQLQTALGSSEG